MKKSDALTVIRKPQKTSLSVVDLPEGDNNKFTTFALAIMQLSDIDIKDPVQLRGRIEEYFKLCAEHDMKPAVAALALAIGLDRRRLWEINNDVEGRNVSIPQECKQLIKMTYTSLEVLWEGYMTSGKINPVSGIFLAKNNFGYRDTQEYVVTPNTMKSDTPIDVIEAKYDELPE